MSLDAEQFKKISPKAFLGRFLEDGIRPDGRDLNTSRGIIVSDGHIGSSDGSSFVRLGNTGIICGLKLEFNNATDSSVVVGELDVNVMLTPICSPNYSIGKPTSQAHYYAQTLKRLFEKFVIDLQELYSPETKQAIIVHADLLCIDHDGSIFDACCLALTSALMLLRIPSMSLKDEKIVYDYNIIRKLTIIDIPISVSFGLFNDFKFVDPDDFEEGVIEDTVTIVLGKNDNILSILKPGGKIISEDILLSMREKARDRVAAVYEVMQGFRMSLNEEMDIE